MPFCSASYLYDAWNTTLLITKYFIEFIILAYCIFSWWLRIVIMNTHKTTLWSLELLSVLPLKTLRFLGLPDSCYSFSVSFLVAVGPCCACLYQAGDITSLTWRMFKTMQMIRVRSHAWNAWALYHQLELLPALSSSLVILQGVPTSLGCLISGPSWT